MMKVDELDVDPVSFRGVELAAFAVVYHRSAGFATLGIRYQVAQINWRCLCESSFSPVP